MAQSQLNLYNLALAIVGSDYTISATNEASIPAETCDMWYENVRQVALRAAHWNSAKRYARLVEDTERDTAADWVSTDPEPGYGFSYALPANMLAARYMTDFSQFTLGYETAAKIISSNIGGSAATDAPILCFTVDVTDLTIWEPDLYQAIAYALAAHVSIPLTGKVSKSVNNFQLANNIILEARAATANEIRRFMTQRPETLAARGYSYTVAAPYVYPYGALFSNTGAPVT